jgi:lipopolysaccharide transport system ATP-binding protein
VRIKGRVASLLEVGTGFHPELTGRENIFLNGAVLGMTKLEIQRRFDEIVAFAEIDRFVNTPVKRYSSGMYVRLAFAVAAHLEPEILIVDEVLAVGDMQFQKKCLGKMQHVAGEGRTILFVSHNMAAVRTLCKKGLVLNGGRVVQNGGTEDCVEFYQSGNGIRRTTWRRQGDPRKGQLLFESVEAQLEGRQPELSLILDISLASPEQHSGAFLAFDIIDRSGVSIMQAIPRLDGFIKSENPKHRVRVKITLPPMIPDRYSVSLWAGPHNTETLDFVPGAVNFDIVDSPTAGRTFPHHASHGYIVPQASVDLLNS